MESPGTDWGRLLEIASQYLVLMKKLFTPYLVSAVSLSVVLSGCSKAPVSQPTQNPKAQEASANPSEAEVEQALLASYKTRYAMTGKVDSVAIDTLRWGKPFKAGSSSDNGLAALSGLETPQPGVTVFPAEIVYRWFGEVVFAGKGEHNAHMRWDFFVNLMGDWVAVPVSEIKE